MKQLAKKQFIDLAKRLAEHLEVEGVIIVYVPIVMDLDNPTTASGDNLIGSCSYGANKAKCALMRKLMDHMIDAVKG